MGKEKREKESKKLAVTKRLSETPISPFHDLDEFFDRAMGGWPFERPGWLTRRFGDLRLGRHAWAPRVDVLKSEKGVTVKADLPGLKAEDIKVDVQHGVLTISGSREEAKETKEKDYYRSERFSGSFSRSIALPEGAEADKISADYKDGVLEVTVPTSGEAGKAKAIPVQQKQ
ncbi:MAG: Hsp20/alpha crystallin family protein [Chloroflexi bacterium]|nr:Hsp20/alpha crystallin family protein [Chloroflexota bacterium]